MKRILFLLVIILISFSACKNKGNFVVNGIIKGDVSAKYIYLNRVEVNTPVLIDSAKISNGGKFSFKIKSVLPDFYQLGFSTADFITILATPGEKINITFEGRYLYDNYTVTGSPETEKIKILEEDLAMTRSQLDSLSNLYNRIADAEGPEGETDRIEEQFRSVIKAQRKKNIEFIIKNTTSLSAIKALYQKIDEDTYVLYDPKDLQYLKIVNDSLSKYYPRSRHVQALAGDFTREMGEVYANQIQRLANNVPESRLDPDLESADGKRIALSSLRGKYVLLSFWSVKSSACVRENLELKEYYRQFKGKGFEIYQVNIDQDKEAWRNAVKFDELPWINTSEDESQQNIRMFNVTSVPANFLFDKQGNIIARDLHGKALQIKLNQLFN
jgi:peroxiredoxin